MRDCAEIPIIFSGPMVRAWLEGRKTMTRRLAWGGHEAPCAAAGKGFRPSLWQKVKPGDRLWVRENLCQRHGEFLGIKQNVMNACYAADEAPVLERREFNVMPWWRAAGGLPSIHMPRDASRITLVVTAVRIERLQGITEEDAKAEGAEPAVAGVVGPDGGPAKTHRSGFVRLWSTLHGPESWLSNPEVVVITAIAHKVNIDAMEKAA